MIIENQFNCGAGDGFSTDRSIEDYIRHGLTTQMFGAGFAHHPTHGIDNVRFTATVRADNSRHVGLKWDGCRIHKGFESRELDTF